MCTIPHEVKSFLLILRHNPEAVPPVILREHIHGTYPERAFEILTQPSPRSLALQSFSDGALRRGGNKPGQRLMRFEILKQVQNDSRRVQTLS
jgi:hypothetical protein